MLSPLLPSPLPVPSVHLDGTPPLSCEARRTCVRARVCLDVRGSQLKDFLVFAMPASGSCVRHAQWCEAGGVGWWWWGVGGGDRGREEEEIGVESKRGKERKGICVRRELSKDSRAHLWSGERLFTDFTACTASGGAARHRRLPQGCQRLRGEAAESILINDATRKITEELFIVPSIVLTFSMCRRK